MNGSVRVPMCVVCGGMSIILESRAEYGSTRHCLDGIGCRLNVRIIPIGWVGIIVVFCLVGWLMGYGWCILMVWVAVCVVGMGGSV